MLKKTTAFNTIEDNGGGLKLIIYMKCILAVPQLVDPSYPPCSCTRHPVNNLRPFEFSHFSARYILFMTPELVFYLHSPTCILYYTLLLNLCSCKHFFLLLWGSVWCKKCQTNIFELLYYALFTCYLSMWSMAKLKTSSSTITNSKRTNTYKHSRKNMDCRWRVVGWNSVRHGPQSVTHCTSIRAKHSFWSIQLITYCSFHAASCPWTVICLYKAWCLIAFNPVFIIEPLEHNLESRVWFLGCRSLPLHMHS